VEAYVGEAFAHARAGWSVVGESEPQLSSKLCGDDLGQQLWEVTSQIQALTPVVAEVVSLRKDVAKLRSNQASLTKERLAQAITFREFEEEAAADGSHSLSAESVARLLASRVSVHVVNCRTFTAHAVNMSDLATSCPSTWSATCGWRFSSRDAVLRTGIAHGSCVFQVGGVQSSSRAWLRRERRRRLQEERRQPRGHLRRRGDGSQAGKVCRCRPYLALVLASSRWSRKALGCFVGRGCAARGCCDLGSFHVEGERVRTPSGAWVKPEARVLQSDRVVGPFLGRWPIPGGSWSKWSGVRPVRWQCSGLAHALATSSLPCIGWKQLSSAVGAAPSSSLWIKSQTRSDDGYRYMLCRPGLRPPTPRRHCRRMVV